MKAHADIKTKKILQLGIYPVKGASHGGPKRARAIADFYRQQGVTSKYVGVYSKATHFSLSPSDIRVSSETDSKIIDNRNLEDIICGKAIYDDEKVRKKLMKLIDSYKPDYIQVEQLYPYLGLRKLMSENNLNIDLIYSSHNFESELKKEAFPESISSILNEIESAEKELIKRSKLIISVSQEDEKQFEMLGATNVVIANNGSNPPSKNPDTEFWNRWKNQNGVENIILYVASAHPPNWDGFIEMVGKEMGFLRPDTKIIIAGSLGEYVLKVLEGSKIASDITFFERVHIAGRVSDSRLAGLLRVADVVILPIISGGGSNLKTAEALINRKNIVATSFAFRSFEEFIDSPNVKISDNKQDFRNSIIDMLKNNSKESTNKQEGVNKLEWSKSLHPILAALERL